MYLCMRKDINTSYAWVGETIEKAWKEAKEEEGHQLDIQDCKFFSIGEEIHVEEKLIIVKKD